MKINTSALTLAVTLLALWALRRLGVDGDTADAILSALLVGLGLSRPAFDSEPKADAPKDEPKADESKADESKADEPKDDEPKDDAP